MRFKLSHTTRYTYASPVDVAHHVLRLDVRRLPVQEVEHARIACEPQAASITARSDHFGNRVTHLRLAHPHDSLVIAFTATGRVHARVVPDGRATPPWEVVAGDLRGDGFPEPLAESEFALPSPLAGPFPELVAFARACFPAGAPVLIGARRLTRAIYNAFRYDPAATDVTTPVAQAFRMRAGVCQDFAHLQIAGLRGLGLAARYVSGYLATRPRPGMPALRGFDASHAWASVWCGAQAGWIDLDPTNDCVVGQNHVVAAWGRDYGDVSPVRGVLSGGGAHRLEVGVDLDVDAGTDTIRGVDGR
jgi:transglutaminase-like putative cysteine protease